MKSNVPSLMKKKGITFYELVEQSGLSKETITRARKDDKIQACTLSTLRKIAMVLGVKVADLYENGD